MIGGNASQSLWIAGAVEELLSCSAKINSAVHNQENFIANLRLCINQTSFGSINEFAHTTGTWHVTIRRLLKGSSMPTMEMLMRICFALNLSPEKLFLNLNSDIPVGSACLPEIQDGLKNYSLLCESPEDIEKSKKQITDYLENLLTENPPVSGRQAAQRLGWRDSRLYRSFPDLYRRIVLRYKKFSESNVSVTDDEVKEILQAAAKESPPPSLQSVLRRFGCKNTGYRYQQKFPYHCKNIARRFKEYRNRLLDDESRLNDFIETVTNENPPPSASQVAERLEITRERLRLKFPNQYKTIVNRSAEHILKERKKVLIQLETEVEKAVREIIEENMYPSEERVKARLSCGYNDGNFKKVLSKVKNRIAIPFKPRY